MEQEGGTVICENGHIPEIMCQFIKTSNRGFTVEDIVYSCPKCGNEVHDTPSDTMFELRSYYGTQCWTCAHMDISERSEDLIEGNGDDWEIPGRCYEKGCRILLNEMPSDGTCKYFLLRQSKLRDRMLHSARMGEV